jgi:putative flavoprotein involved in K+ transport
VGFDEIVEHYARHVRACAEPPLLIGHSLGGLIVQVLLDRNLGRGAIALCPAPPRGILPLHGSVVRAMAPQLSRRSGWRRIARLSFENWQRDYAGSMPVHDQRASFARYVVPESGRIWYQLAGSLMGGAGGISFRNRSRRPLLLIAADEDHVAPVAMVSANRRAFLAETALHVLAGRGHWVLADHDADELADLIDAFALRLWSQPARRQPLSSPAGPAPRHVVIIGGGPAGLATATALKRRGVESVILERAAEVGQSWRRHYDRLRLHTMRSLSGLPGMAIPRAWGTWVAAHDFASYLERYARHHRLEVAVETTVTRLSLEAPRGAWRIETSRGVWGADQVVVATGLNQKPRLPDWAGAGRNGLVVHSSAYRGPAMFRGRDVLVVGAGNSGAEIAADLAEGGAARVRLAVRTGPNLVPRTVLGVPIQVFGVLMEGLPPRPMDFLMHGMQRLFFGDVSKLGLPRPTRGAFTRMMCERAIPIIDVGLVAALTACKVEVVAGVAAISDGEVQLLDDMRLAPDAVIAATGYRPALDSLFGDELEFDEAGLPSMSASGEVAGTRGLYCVGYLVSAGGALRAIARQAEDIAGSICGNSRG